MLYKLKFDTELDSKLTADVCVLNFSATWSEPCTQMNAVFAELANKYSNFTFVQIDAEEFEETAERFDIESVPTVILLKSNKEIARVVGLDTKALVDLLASPILTQPRQIALVAPKLDVTSDAHLHSLISSHEIMLFIKGTPDQPKCGFSRTAIELVTPLRVKYGTFDILSSQPIREALKLYTNWPTYPMVFVNNEMIGGVDILREMVTDGGFQAMLKQDSIAIKLSKLINKSNVMLFMKGNPKRPECGFSNTIVGILNDLGVEFDSFNILSDEEVRQELKVFSNWPTYPQLYVKGELIGGLDILKEMVQSGEFQSML